MRFLFGIFRRSFWLVAGVVLGWVSSLAMTRRLRRFTRRLGPGPTGDRMRRDVRDALREGRDAMREREAELRGGPPPGK
ncbi:MAG: hypothetical protein ACKOBG_01515 [Actinomycetota bacterium]